MSEIIAVDAAFNQVIADFSRILPLLNKKDPTVKQIFILVDNAIKVYAKQTFNLTETVNLLIDTLSPSYELMFFCNNSAAKTKFLKQHHLPNHPLRKFIEPLIKAWRLEDDHHG